MGFDPTPEQRAIVDAFTTGGDVVITAGAGTGKTSTLEMIANATPGRTGVYLAYNSAIAKEAARRFPASTNCRTAHSLAFAAVGKQFAHRLKAPRMTGRDTARLLRINSPLRISEVRVLAPAQLANIALNTVARFCNSGDTEIGQRHVPRDIAGAETPEALATLASVVVPAARTAWHTDLTKTDGSLRFSHDCYLKSWALSEPRINADFIFLDEAQDTNGAVASVFDRQRHAQRVAVGDANQAIYGWRGATDYMSTMDAPHRLMLSVSWRFGPQLADEANKWLTILKSDLRITGNGDTTIGACTPDAILCRTNAEAVGSLIAAHDQGRKAALVGGGTDLRKFAEAAEELRDRGRTWHPELTGFDSWGAVLDYVEADAGGEDFKVAVKLIDTYGTAGVISAIDRSVPEERAELVISTAHKSKGREWNAVRIANDFSEPKVGEGGVLGQVDRGEGMLAYVAVTRAKKNLDRGGLSWVDHYVPVQAEPAPPVIEATGERGKPLFRLVDAEGNALTEWSENYRGLSAEFYARGDNAIRMQSRSRVQEVA